jgi:hypothetical protein
MRLGTDFTTSQVSIEVFVFEFPDHGPMNSAFL